MLAPGEVICTLEEKNMAVHDRDSGRPDRRKNGPAEKQPGDDACRCKETSDMTPRQLLSLMMRDLSFWKKTKKGH